MEKHEHLKLYLKKHMPQLEVMYKFVPFKAQLFSILRALYSPPPCVWRHLYFNGIIKVRHKNKSFKMKQSHQRIENVLFWSGLAGDFEKTSLSLWINLSKVSKCIMDIGASRGVYALTAKTFNPSAKVYAFEPLERDFKTLQYNCALNRYDIICEQAAVSSYDGAGTIYLPEGEDLIMAALDRDVYFPKHKATPEPARVVRLSTYIKMHNIAKIDLLKCDVETSEPEVLEGMGVYLQEMRPAMIIEILNSEVASRVEKILGRLDYLYFSIDEDSGLSPVEHITRDEPWCSNLCNYLVCTSKDAKRLNLK